MTICGAAAPYRSRTCQRCAVVTFDHRSARRMGLKNRRRRISELCIFSRSGVHIMIRKTALEKVAGHDLVAAAGGAAGIAVAAGAALNPLLVLVPGLLQGLATVRQTARIEKSLQDLEQLALSHSEQIKVMTDDQFQVVSSVVASVLTTVNQEKFEFLKLVAKGAITNQSEVAGVSEALSRAIRDISADEVKFIVSNFKFRSLFLDDELEAPNAETLAIKAKSNDAVLFAGLISLGLLVTTENTWDAQNYGWSPLVAKLIALLNS